MDNAYTPNYWQIVKITSLEGKVIHKVFASWSEGYTYGDSWKLNSGIEEVIYENDYVMFKGYSGSIYKCLNKDHVYRSTAYTHGILKNMMLKADKIGAKIEVLPYQTKFEGIENESSN